LKIFPAPADSATALVGIDTPRHALELLARMRTAAGDQVTTFELMPRLAIALAVKYVPGVADPSSFDCPWFVLVELTSPNPKQNLEALLAMELAEAAERGIVKDAMLAASTAQAQAIWKLRESIPEGSAVTAPASSTMCPCRYPRSRRSSTAAAR